MVRVGWSGAALVLVLMFAMLQWSFAADTVPYDCKSLPDPEATKKACAGTDDANRKANPACACEGSLTVATAIGIAGASLLAMFF